MQNRDGTAKATRCTQWSSRDRRTAGVSGDGGCRSGGLTCKIMRFLVAVWSKLLTSLPGSKLSTTVSEQKFR